MERCALSTHPPLTATFQRQKTPYVSPSDMTGESVLASSEAEMSITTQQPVKPNSKGEAYSSTSV